MVFSQHLYANAGEILSALGRSCNALAGGSKLSKARCLFLFELAFQREYCAQTAGE